MLPLLQRTQANVFLEYKNYLFQNHRGLIFTQPEGIIPVKEWLEVHIFRDLKKIMHLPFREISQQGSFYPLPISGEVMIYCGKKKKCCKKYKKPGKKRCKKCPEKN